MTGTKTPQCNRVRSTQFPMACEKAVTSLPSTFTVQSRSLLLVGICVVFLRVLGLEVFAQEFKPGTRVVLLKDSTLYFNSTPGRPGKAGEAFNVAAFRPTEKRVYLLAKDQSGRDIALWVPQDAVKVMPPAGKPTLATFIGRSELEPRQPIPDVHEQAVALEVVGVDNDSATISENPKKVEEALMQTLAGASGSYNGREVAALLEMIDALPAEQRKQVRVNGVDLDQTSAKLKKALYEGDTEVIRDVLTKTVAGLGNNPILSTASVRTNANSMTPRAQVAFAKRLRKEGCCVAEALQLLPLNRKMLSDVIEPSFWRTAGALDLVNAVQQHDGGKSFADLWRNICTFENGANSEAMKKLGETHLGFLNAQQRSKFCALVTSRFANMKGTWLNNAKVLTDIKDAELAVEMALLIVSEDYKRHLGTTK